MDKAMREITSKLPKKISDKLRRVFDNKLQEIRFRIGRPIMLYYSDRKSYLGEMGECSFDEGIISTYQDIEEIVTGFCQNSVYAYSEDIKEGFITLEGGHRVGIGGRAVGKRTQILNIADFSSVNIRIAREYKGCADACINEIRKNQRIFNTIIIAPPGAGKTTLLRDVARNLSCEHKVSIIDERFEIAGVREGVPQFDIGIETDVLSGFSKRDGIIHALRSLSPDVIVCDEIGSKEDILSVENILKGGCKIITTMHGYGIEEIKKKHELISLFEVGIVLHKNNGKPEVLKCIKLWE